MQYLEWNDDLKLPELMHLLACSCSLAANFPVELSVLWAEM
jgi:hypothetical protein